MSERLILPTDPTWPQEYFAALLDPLFEWGKDRPATYHHIGYTHPDAAAFDAAVAQLDGDVISSDLVMPNVTHHRRYMRFPGRDGAQDTFVEHHLAGDSGNGVRGVHFDFITEDAQGMLDYVRENLDTEGLDVRVVTQGFGGGNAPVGKVALQPMGDPTIEVGVMSRTHWSDPVNW